MGIGLTSDDFSKLKSILAAIPDFRTESSRWAMMDDIFAGNRYKDKILGLLELSGNSNAAATKLITRLDQYGGDDSGEKTLGLVINHIQQTYMGNQEDADFLKELFNRYPFTGKPIDIEPIKPGEWRGTDTEDYVAELVIGENTLRDIRILEIALIASESVVRIMTDKGKGSGFLVGQNLIMTNHHVIDSRLRAEDADYQFFYQLDLNNNPMRVNTCQAKRGGLFYKNPREGGLDFTIIELETTPENVKPLNLKSDRVRKNDRVVIIQHPRGEYKKISMQNNFVEYADGRVVQYLTTTDKGSSGSPVFNDDFFVVGIHHSGGELLEPGTYRRYLRNAGSSMIAILEDICSSQEHFEH